MKFSTEFQVSAAPGVVGAALADLGFLQHCLATQVTGSELRGRALRGLMSFRPDEEAAVYQVVVTVQEVDEDERWLRIAVRGRERRGGGLGLLNVTACLREAVGATIVSLDSHLVLVGVHQDLSAGQAGPLADKAAAGFGARVDELLRDPAELAAWPGGASGFITNRPEGASASAVGSVGDARRGREPAMVPRRERARILLAAGVLGTTVLAGVLIRRAMGSPVRGTGSNLR